MNVDRLLRNNTYLHPEQEGHGFASLEATIRSLKRDLTTALKEQRVCITKQIRRQSDDVAEQLRELKESIQELKEEKLIWLKYEKSRDDLLRAI